MPESNLSDPSSADNGHPLKRANGLVLVLNTPKGRGVFASQPIAKGNVIDISPVLILSSSEVNKHIEHTSLNHYTYYWPSPNSRTPTQALALGLGSLFNHSTLHHNVGWRRDQSIDSIVYTALRDIEAGEELCISYGSGRLWFPDADGADEAIGDGSGSDHAEQDLNDGRGRTLGELGLSGLSEIGIDLEEGAEKQATLVSDRKEENL